MTPLPKGEARGYTGFAVGTGKTPALARAPSLRKRAGAWTIDNLQCTIDSYGG